MSADVNEVGSPDTRQEHAPSAVTPDQLLRRERRKLITICVAGTLLIGLAVGVREWWTRGAPARAAQQAAATRHAEIEAHLKAGRDAVAAAPNDWRAHDALATALVAEGMADEAIAEWRKGTEVAKGSLESMKALAEGYLAMRRLAAAEETYRQIAQKWPKLPDGHMGLAVVHRHQGRLRKALDSARTAVKLGPNSPDNAYVFGVIVEELGASLAHPTGMTQLLEEGRTQLKKAAKTLKEQPDIDYRLGRICLLIRRYDEAKAALERAVKATPTRTVAWLALSEARLRTGDTDGAIEAARTGRETGPVDFNAPLTLGKALLLKKDRASLEEAAEALKGAVRLNPESADAMKRLGTALLRLNRLEEAGAIFEDASRLNPHDPYPPQQLSQLYQRTGHRDLAMQAARRASTLSTNQSLLRQLQRTSATHPENGLVHRALADRYRELGWWGPAADEYDLALQRLPNDAKSKEGLAAARKMQAQGLSE